MSSLSNLVRTFNFRQVHFRQFQVRSVTNGQDPDGAPLSKNDKVAPMTRNRNPMNLEKMRIGYKPSGFDSEASPKKYWNLLQLKTTGRETTATVTHWTGRHVCSASTKEWAIQKFLYNTSDIAALRIVAQVLSKPNKATDIPCILKLDDCM